MSDSENTAYLIEWVIAKKMLREKMIPKNK